MSEVGVTLEELRISYLSFTPPQNRRFKSTKEDIRYQGTIRLEYISAIYDMVRLDKSLYHLVVKQEIEE